MIFTRTPLLSTPTLGDSLPASDEQDYWVDHLGSIVVTDTGQQTITSNIIFYWADHEGNTVIDHLGNPTSLYHVR